MQSMRVMYTNAFRRIHLLRYGTMASRHFINDGGRSKVKTFVTSLRMHY